MLMYRHKIPPSTSRTDLSVLMTLRMCLTGELTKKKSAFKDSLEWNVIAGY